jgi:ribosome-associated translation inhibitor RaiA
MRLNLQHLNLRSLDTLDSWVERQILALGQARQIDEANVRLERLENASPAYQVNVHLVTPGPDVFAESRDHTLRAAFGKVMKQLREQITSRATKRLQKVKSNSSAPAVKSRGARGS